MNKEKEKQLRYFNFTYSLFMPFVWLLWPMKVRGRENIPEGAAVICANHTNLLDPVLITIAMGRRRFVRHMAKAENRKIPVLGWLMEKMGSIFVRRDAKDYDSVRSSLKALADGEKLMIFPEGTRVREGEHVEPHDGAAYLAARKQVPLLPVYVERNKRLFHRVKVVFGEPYLLPMERHGDMKAHSEELMERIQALGKEP